MIRLLKLLGNIVDPSWWADLIGEKSGAYERARKPNKFKEWKLKQPLWKQFFIEVLMFTLIALAFEPVLNMLVCQCCLGDGFDEPRRSVWIGTFTL